MDRVAAPCSNCLRNTSHEVLHFEGRDFDESFEGYHEMFQLIECAGCKRISLAHIYAAAIDEEAWKLEYETSYFPSPASRPQPWWLLEQIRLFGLRIELDEDLRALFVEIYEALAGGQHRLAAMGVRALLEQVMILKVGDHGSFSKNLDAFCDKGFASPVQVEAIKAVLDVGHAAMHRKFKPTKQDLDTTLDIAEGIFAAIYVHTRAASELSNRIPPRTPSGKIIPWKGMGIERPDGTKDQ